MIEYFHEIILISIIPVLLITIFNIQKLLYKIRSLEETTMHLRHQRRDLENRVIHLQRILNRCHNNELKEEENE